MKIPARLRHNYLRLISLIPLLSLLFVFLSFISPPKPAQAIPLPPCGCPNVPCGEGEYCRIDFSCEPSGTGRCYSEGELPPCGCPNVPCGEGEYCRIDFSCEPSGTGRCYSEEEELPEELPPACTDKCCPTAIGCIPINLTDAGKYLFCIMLDLVGLLALIMFVAGGYQVMAAGDDPKALEEGKSRMTSAILGFLAFLLFAWIIRSILGIEIPIPIVCHISP